MGVSERIWAKLPTGTRAALTDGLSGSDLQSLLLELSRERAAKVTPARLLERWRGDRFVQPSTADPRALIQTQARLWAALPDRFEGVELSPVTPLGTCSAVGTINQHQVLSTIRGTEVASDPTNELALEAAVRRRSGQARVDLAACQRVVRAQPVQGPGMFAHFQLFVLVSSARDTGSGRTEAAMLIDHLSFWADVLGEHADLSFTTFTPSAVHERIQDTVRPALNNRLREDAERTKSATYYAGTALGIGLADAELGDGGFTTWTADLLGDAKERCLTSCISTERLTAVSAGPRR
ncbi:hypothetical protein HPO96_15605 [Kribbella sandramycini]|uniref:Uncharacterized protein n=1 Tax=Kribbella sandramycini TaxID=60450 RepID=A0A7Y4NZ56_9ACTN|nr:hypothetical protein [Kribbella sandramycini]MBB6565404.1 hypothetical protein [Kribbella sandramycini]NOL41672.1 hypothetical protein [Kribbella sandramycini]